MNQIDVIMFDWGGTLARVARQAERFAIGAAQASRILSTSASPAAVQRLGMAILEAETKAAADPEHREADLNAVLAAWAAGLSSRVSPEQLAAARETLGLQWIGSLDVFPGVLDAVAELKRHGYRIGLVSNCTVPREYCLKELGRQGLAAFLDFTIVSSGVGYRKPSPVIYQAAIREAFPNGRQPELSRVLFVGDSPAFDVIAPAEMGMRTALVGGPPSLWPEEDYIRARPDLRLDSVTELPALLSR